MKEELGGKIKFAGLRAKTYSYLIDDGSEDKKTKRTKTCVIKRKLKFENHKSCLEANKSILKSQQRFKSETHNVFTEEINKITISSNDYKTMQSIDSIVTYAHGTNKDLVSEKEVNKCSNIKNDTKMITFDNVIKENIKEHNPN